VAGVGHIGAGQAAVDGRVVESARVGVGGKFNITLQVERHNKLLSITGSVSLWARRAAAPGGPPGSQAGNRPDASADPPRPCGHWPPGRLVRSSWMKLYQQALFLGELAWSDASKLAATRPMLDLSDQLYRATGSTPLPCAGLGG